MVVINCDRERNLHVSPAETLLNEIETDTFLCVCVCLSVEGVVLKTILSSLDCVSSDHLVTETSRQKLLIICLT